jgi:hypothetical protein
MIHDEQLVVEPDCAVDYPWDAYSFVIKNWPLVAELWPPSVSPRASTADPTVEPRAESTAEPTVEPKKRRWSLRRQMLDAIVRQLYGPEGPGDVGTAAIEKQVADGWPAECRTRGVDPKKTPIPSWDMVNDHLGRRKRRH